ncbi:MAG: hypothetical protein HY804_09530 [Nitrospinae bacterium]|nr:hypothetical protein [Nitrospinota bacterium]
MKRIANAARTMAAITLLTMTAACATGASRESGDLLPLEERSLSVHTIYYRAAPAPRVWEKKFTSKVEISRRGEVRSYRFFNFVEGTGKPPLTVTLALSGAVAGLAIYGANGAPLAEYIGPEVITSLVQSYDAAGTMVYSEITWYRPR